MEKLLSNPKVIRNLQLMIRALQKQGWNIKKLSRISGVPPRIVYHWLYQTDCSVNLNVKAKEA